MFCDATFRGIFRGAVVLAGLAAAAVPGFVRAGDDGPALPRPANAAKMSAGEARELIDKHLGTFYDDTLKMLDFRMETLKGSFEKAKEGAPVFASQTLGIEAKFRAAGSLFERFATKTAELFGAEPAGTDSFTQFARRCFRENVLDPAVITPLVGKTGDAFRGDIAEAEGRLLVALKADIPDDVLGDVPAAIRTAGEAIALRRSEELITETVDAAINDLNASLAMFVVSNFLGNLAADQVTPDDATGGGKLARNLAVGVAVDAAIEKGVRGMGYDPEGAIASRVKTGIDRISAELIDTDPALDKLSSTVALFQRRHPDPAVRHACDRANEALKKTANLGLKQRLERLRNQRAFSLWKTLMTHLAGPEAAASPFMMFEPLDAAKCAPAADIIRWADGIAAKYSR